VNIFALEIWYNEGRVCNFYTVRFVSDHDMESETDKFFEKYSSTKCQFRESAFELFHLITESIGNRYGAIDDFFDRNKNKAQALPPRPKYWIDEIKILGNNFPLRLYCYKISEQIVVLFNGGIKSATTDQLSPDLSLKFNEAQQFAKLISENFVDGMFQITDDERYLESFDGKKVIII
jgi:hypothetical protein